MVDQTIDTVADNLVAGQAYKLEVAFIAFPSPNRFTPYVVVLILPSRASTRPVAVEV